MKSSCREVSIYTRWRWATVEGEKESQCSGVNRHSPHPNSSFGGSFGCTGAGGRALPSSGSADVLEQRRGWESCGLRRERGEVFELVDSGHIRSLCSSGAVGSFEVFPRRMKSDQHAEWFEMLGAGDGERSGTSCLTRRWCFGPGVTLQPESKAWAPGGQGLGSGSSGTKNEQKTYSTQDSGGPEPVLRPEASQAGSSSGSSLGRVGLRRSAHFPVSGSGVQSGCCLCKTIQNSELVLELSSTQRWTRPFLPLGLSSSAKTWGGRTWFQGLSALTSYFWWSGQRTLIAELSLFPISSSNPRLRIWACRCEKDLLKDGKSIT